MYCVLETNNNNNNKKIQVEARKMTSAKGKAAWPKVKDEQG